MVYERMVLRLPYRIIKETKELFNEGTTEATLISIIKSVSERYSETENISIQRILESPFIHVDETQINVQGTNHYVWVFTNGNYVFFRITETHESKIVHELLSNFKGILITDFYGGYDAIPCKQQKCLAHLMRDFNNDLWSNPYNFEYEKFVNGVRNLLTPIFDAEKKYGLRHRNLGKFTKNVEKFYQENIETSVSANEIVSKYQKRFQRCKHSLFTFLEMNGIPWHNNTAENAIKHLAVQRKISGTFFKSAASQYLLLLGITQTCRFQNKSLLKFLLSGEINIEKFKSPKKIRYSTMTGVKTRESSLD